MDDWYKASDFKQDQLLDELMCEYIDGTMDPSVQNAFDELVSTNPSIARQIEGLTEAKSILKQTGCSLCAPRQFQSRLRARLDAETGKIHVYGLPVESTNRPTRVARYALLVAIFVWGGVALPWQDGVGPPTTPTISANAAPSTSSRSTLLMTLATRPENIELQPIRGAERLIRINHASSQSNMQIETAEAELSLLGD